MFINAYLDATREPFVVFKDTHHVNVPDLLSIASFHAPKLVIRLTLPRFAGLLHSEDLNELLVVYLRSFYLETSHHEFIETFGPDFRTFILEAFMCFAHTEDILRKELARLADLAKKVDRKLGAYYYKTLRTCLVETIYNPDRTFAHLKPALLGVFTANMLPMLNAGALKSLENKPFMRISELDNVSDMSPIIVQDFYTTFLRSIRTHPSAFVGDDPLKLELFRLGQTRPEVLTLVNSTLDSIRKESLWFADDNISL
jgi:hypothetical protein